MKASEYAKLIEKKPFYAESDGEIELFIKLGGDIYGFGWDTPINPDNIEFIEYVLPCGTKLPIKDDLLAEVAKDADEAADKLTALLEGE